MVRSFKKFYVFTFFIMGIFFYAMVKNLRPPEEGSPPSSPSKGEGPTGGGGSNHRQFYNKAEASRTLIMQHLTNLEGELADQKHYSDNLLNKLREKFSPPNANQKSRSRTSKELLANKAKGVGSGSGSDKLKALQEELQQEAHAGEVRSDIEEDVHHNHGGKRKDKEKEVEEFANGEVIDEQAPTDNHKEGKNKANGGGGYVYADEDSVIAVLVFVCDRPSIKRSLDKLFEYRPSGNKFPIIVSQDCGADTATTAVLKSYEDRITHIMQPDLSEIDVPPKEKKFKGYYKIARHYGWALNYTFNQLNHQNVIVVEDDLEIASDFFEYFAATLPILKKDPSIWCVSAWNDNGKPKRINETAYDLLHRSDFFPGLGWMMTKELWSELMVKWPRGYWDDWMREPAQRKDRVCIRPEISRTSTFGKEGVSLGTYFMNHLRFIKLNDHFVPFKSRDLSYLLKDNYDVEFVRRVYSSQLVNSVTDLLAQTSETPKPTPIEYRLVYRTKTDFRNYAKKLEIMEDFKAGVPRTAYRGVVPFFLNGHRCYLAPGANWESYQPF